VACASIFALRSLVWRHESLSRDFVPFGYNFVLLTNFASSFTIVASVLNTMSSDTKAGDARLGQTVAETDRKLYFGFGSNLWKLQMKRRCPDSHFLGIAKLNGWTWIINSRGYANVVETSIQTDEVWGLIYSLSSEDEAKLDKNEGVPYDYTKEMHIVDFRASTSTSIESSIDTTQVGSGASSRDRNVLVYVDRTRLKPDTPREEYIHRMNMGIKDAVEEGVPLWYIQDILRKYIPPEEISEEGKKLAEEQALDFNEKKERAR